MANYTSLTCPNCIGIGYGTGQGTGQGFEDEIDDSHHALSKCKVCNASGRQIICYTCNKICSMVASKTCSNCSTVLKEECSHPNITERYEEYKGDKEDKFVTKCNSCEKTFKIKQSECFHSVVSQDNDGFYCSDCKHRLVEVL